MRLFRSPPAVLSLAALALTASFVSASSCAAQTVARQWDEALLRAIRIDVPKPTVHSRNLYHTSAAMYDAWAAFDPIAGGNFYVEKHSATDIAAARDEAISYAAYRVLSKRYQLATDPVASQQIFDGLMNQLGYDKSITSTAGNTPAAIGNRIAAQILAATIDDGANEANAYADNTDYQPVNVPMVVDYPGLVTPDAPPLADPNRWQPLFLDSAVTQNGLGGDKLQIYIGPHWGNVQTFALGRNDALPHSWSAIDPGPPPQLGGLGDSQYRADTVELIRYSNSLDANQGSGADVINISPSVNGNRPLGTHENQGYTLNPATGLPYADNLVKQADYGRVLAEFWADGPDSETPPGHWNVIANQVSSSPLLEKRVGGAGPIVDDLEWDVKLYLSLNGAVHDAAVAAWGVKREYDYVRPITKIRYQGSLGQSSDEKLPAYDPNGLPLQPGLIEQITAASIAPGGRHRNAYENANRDADGNFTLFYAEEQMVGKIVIHAWNHEPDDPTTEASGTNWILAENWVPYQNDNFVTPAFAAYVSGHSTFSRASAEILAAFTGDEFFPGGLGEMEFPSDFLNFEQGPSQPVTLQWASYFDAADEAGISRLWGGIHVSADDFAGRIMGSMIGQEAFQFAQDQFVDDQLGWHNRIVANDVDHNGAVALSDAVLIINEAVLHQHSDPTTGELDGFTGIPAAFYDVREDGVVAASDAIPIINEIALRSNSVPLSLLMQGVPEPHGATMCWALVALLGCRCRGDR